MALTVLNGPIIEAGESLSDTMDCTGGELVRITMPADWTYSAGITFQISTDGEFFNNLFDAKGAEVMVVVTPGAAVVVPPDVARVVAFVKFRSGTAQTPVPQPARREFAVAVDQAEAP